MRNRADQITRVAFHEAGHALVAHCLGLRVGRVDVFADGSGGNCFVDSSHVPLDRRAKFLAAVALAGCVAEGFYLSEAPERLTSFPEDARKALTYAPRDPDARRAFIEDAALLADRIIRQGKTWAEVSRFAEGLVKRAS